MKTRFVLTGITLVLLAALAACKPTDARPASPTPPATFPPPPIRTPTRTLAAPPTATATRAILRDLIYMGRILFTDENDLYWMVQANGADPHEIENPGVLSPDGNLSVKNKEPVNIFSSEGMIFILEVYSAGHKINDFGIEIKGGLETQIHELTWSPDNKTIAFIYQNDVYSVQTDGSSLRRITNHNQEEFFCSKIFWSPGADKIAVRCVSNLDPGLSGLYIVSLSGGGTTFVPVAYGPYSLAWTPDEQHIFFVGHCNLVVNGNISTYDKDTVYIVDADGQKLREYWDAESSSDLTLSPDGKYIAFSGRDPYDTNGFEIFLIHTDTLKDSLLPDNTSDLGKYYKVYLWTDNTFDDYHPSWSRDSRHIVYASSNGRSGLFVLSLDTRQERQLLDFGKEPVWLPNP